MTTISELRAAGFSEKEIDEYTKKKAAEWSSAGFSQEEIVVSLTGQKPPNDDAIRRTFDLLLGSAASDEEGKPKPLTLDEAFSAGIGMSVGVPGVFGLANADRLPEKQLTGEEPWYTSLTFAAGQMIGDVPAGVLGAVVGGAGGVETGPGAIATATAGAFAMPTALRSTLIDAFTKGEFKDFGDFLDRSSGIFMDTAQSYVAAALGSAVGGTVGSRLGAAGGAAVPSIGAKVGGKVGYAAGELATVVTIDKMIAEARMGRLGVPNVQDFTNAAILLAGAKVAVRGAKPVFNAVNHTKDVLMDIYRKTGVPPWKVAEDAAKDPTIGQELAAGQGVPSAYRDLVDPMFAERTPDGDIKPITVYHGTFQKDLDKPTTGKAVETPNTIFAAADEDVADTFTLPREYGEPVYFDADGAELTPGKVIPLKIYPKNVFEVPAADAQRFIDDTAFQTKVIEEARKAGHDVVVARGVMEGIGDRFKTDVYALLNDNVMDAPGSSSDPVLGATSASKPSGTGPTGPSTPGGVQTQRGLLFEIAKLLGIQVDVTNDKNYYSEIFNRRITVPSDVNPNLNAGIISADHTFAHELAHAIVSRRGAVFGIKRDNKGRFYIWSNKKLRREIGNWDDFIAASKEFRPEFWNNPALGQQKYVRTPDELIADAIAMVLMGKRHINMLGPLMKTIGMKPEGMGIDPNGGGTGLLPKAATSGPEPGSLREAQETVLSKVDVGGESQKKKTTLSDLYAKVVDDLAPIAETVGAMMEEISYAAGRKVKLSADRDPYKILRLVKGLYGKAQAMLEYGTFDFDTLQNNGKSFSQILKPIRNDLDGFRAYMVSKRALELKDRAIISGIDFDAATKVVAETAAKFEPIFRGLVEYQNKLTDYLRASGVISEEMYKKMLELNKDFVPFYRLLGEAQEADGTGGASPRNPIKMIKGSGMTVIDPLESIIKNTYTYIALADRNAAVKAFYNLGRKTGQPGDYFDEVDPTLRGTTLTKKEIENILEDALGPFAAYVKGAAAPEDFTVFRAVREPLAKDEIQFFENGKRIVLRVEQDVATAFKSLDRETLNILFRFMGGFASVLRAGATLSPDFIVRNPLRDQWGAAVASETGYKMFVDLARGAFHLFGKTETFNEFLKSGAANATLVSMDRRYIQSELSKLLDKHPETNFLDKTWNIVKSPIELLRVMSEVSENATRVGEFARSKAFEKKQTGGTDKRTILESGFRAREIITDFSKSGSQTKALNLISAFFNAKIQGYDQIVNLFAKSPSKTLMRLGLYVTLPSVLLWYNNKDDKRWKDIPGWQRDLFWIVLTDKHIYRIPKPFELGVLFGSLPERLLDKAYGSGSDWQLEKFVSRTAGDFLPLPMPTMIKPVLEHVANYSFLSANPLVPSYMENSQSGLLPEYRYTPYTSELTKKLGSILGKVPLVGDTDLASPIVLDNYIRSWTGGLGAYAVSLADYGLRKTGVLPDPVLPASTLADIPIVKAFLVRYPNASSDTVQEFMETYKRRQHYFNSVQFTARSGDFSSAMELLRLNPTAMVRLSMVSQAISEHNKLIRDVYRNPTIDPDQKRQLIDVTYYNMIEIARQGNEVMKQLDEAGQKQRASP